MANGNNILHDGFRSMEQGVDAGMPEHLLPANQCAYAINATVRGGSPACRPGYAKHVLTFPSQIKKDAFELGVFQGAGFFAPLNNSPCLVASISGRIFSIAIESGYRVTDVTPTTLNSSQAKMAWMLQAEGFLIVQNNIQAPIIWDGAATRRANPQRGEIPTGGPMAYYMGRLWVAQGRNYVASDLVGSSSGTSKYDRKDAILKFTENTYLSGGGSFTVPMQGPGITAMQPVLNLNTALGHTDMAIFSPSGVCVVSVPTDREQWQAMDTPLQRFAQFSNGALCPVTSVNEDIWYRAPDGFRSLIMAVRNFGDWANVPASGELTPILAKDSAHLLGYGSSVNFDNRLLHTISPTQSARGVVHRGLAVLDFDLVSRMRTKLPPAWEGTWTGLRVLKLVYAEYGTIKRCFAFCVSATNLIELWEITKNGTSDDGDPITWSMDFRRMDFKAPETYKQLQGGDVWVDKIRDRTYFSMYYRADRNPNWRLWHSWSECATIERCTADCLDMENRQPQFRPNMALPTPSDECDPLLGRPYRTGYEFQPRLVIQGHCVLSKLHLEALALRPEVLPSAPCLTDAACKTLTVCDPSQYYTVPRDIDADGLPDSWERDQTDTDDLTTLNGTQDTDQDGQTDQEEQQGGTDPIVVDPPPGGGGDGLIQIPVTGIPPLVNLGPVGGSAPAYNVPSGYTAVVVEAGYYGFGTDANEQSFLDGMAVLLWEAVRETASAYDPSLVRIASSPPVWCPYEEFANAKLSIGSKVTISAATDPPTAISAASGIGDVYFNSHPSWTMATYFLVNTP